jgi:pyruvate ferredoxin oxidoreductase gamma subunit
MLDVRWYGRGGQGAFTAARLLGQTASVYGDSYALASPSFGPERRGAPVWSFTKIDKNKITDRSQPVLCNYLVVLDESLITPTIENYLCADGIIILNTAKPDKYKFIKHKLITLDATRLSLEILGRPITNVAMLGAFVGVSDVIGIPAVEKALQQTFSKSICEKNRLLLSKACNAVKGGAK